MLRSRCCPTWNHWAPLVEGFFMFPLSVGSVTLTITAACCAQCICQFPWRIKMLNRSFFLFDNFAASQPEPWWKRFNPIIPSDVSRSGRVLNLFKQGAILKCGTLSTFIRDISCRRCTLSWRQYRTCQQEHTWRLTLLFRRSTRRCVCVCDCSRCSAEKVSLLLFKLFWEKFCTFCVFFFSSGLYAVSCSLTTRCQMI